jgi:hypothetical protein
MRQRWDRRERTAPYRNMCYAAFLACGPAAPNPSMPNRHAKEARGPEKEEELGQRAREEEQSKEEAEGDHCAPGTPDASGQQAGGLVPMEQGCWGTRWGGEGRAGGEGGGPW